MKETTTTHARLNFGTGYSQPTDESFDLDKKEKPCVPTLEQEYFFHEMLLAPRTEEIPLY